MARKLVKESTTSAWDSGGASTDTYSGDCYIVFTVPANMGGVAVGLAPAAVTTGNLALIQHGLRFVAGSPVDVVELGVQRAVSTVPSTPGATGLIRSIGGVVTYYLPGWSYTSSVASSGSRSIDAVLYQFGDTVDEPSLVPTKSLAANSTWNWAAPGVANRMQSRDIFTWAGRARLYISATRVLQQVTLRDLYEPSSNDTHLYEFLGVSDAYQFNRAVYAAIQEVASLGGSFSGRVVINASIIEALVLMGQAAATLVIEAILRSKLTLGDSSNTYAREMLQYATNLDSGAVGRYQGFGFSGFCSVGMDTYGFKPDGLYLLGGDTDDGELMSALIDFAGENFGTMQGKRVESIYLGLSTDGQVFLRLVDDNLEDVTYRALPRKEVYRADMQRGLTSRFWRLRLELVEAQFAVLDNVEWVVAATGRRTTS